MYGIRGVSGKFLGLLLLAANFEHEAKEPEAARVWGKVYRGRFRGEERRSEDLIYKQFFVCDAAFPGHPSRGGVVRFRKSQQITPKRSRGREGDALKN